MTRPVPNMLAPLVNKMGKLIPPWNSWFQQFTQPPSAVASVAVGASTFSYTVNNVGQIIVSGGTVSAITLIRGLDSFILFNDTTTPRSVLVSIGDTVQVTYSVLPTIKFLEL
jgi:hypothetical protein